MKNTVLVGTRDNKLSKLDAQWIINQLQGYSNDYRYQLVEIRTQEDIYDWEEKAGGCKYRNELETALLNDEIDIAVHNMINVPCELPENIVMGAISGRFDPSDVLISRNNLSLDELPRGARIGTGNLRRKSQLLKFRPDFNIVPCRGSVNTRLGRLRKKEVDAFVTAAANLERLGLADKITEYLPYSVCMPAAGQGAVAVEARAKDTTILGMLERVHNPMVAGAVLAERALLRHLCDGGNVPVGVLVRIKGKRLHLEAIALSIDGQDSIRAYGTGYYTSPEDLGIKVAEKLASKGTEKILDGSWYVERVK